MAHCQTVLWLISLILFVCLVQAEEKKGCAKARSALPSNIATHPDVSTLMKNIKRSVVEETNNDSNDCDDAKKSKVTIQQAAVTAIPGQNEMNKKKSSVTSSDTHDYLMLPNHQMNIQRNVLGIKRGNLFRKPISKVTKKSPLWNLSKLIDEVDSSTPNKKNSTPVTVSDTASEVHPNSQPIIDDIKTTVSQSAVAKGNVANDPSKSIKATLSKAIEKVEKVIASRNANLITPNKQDDNPAKADTSNQTKEIPAAGIKENVKTNTPAEADVKNKTTTPVTSSPIERTKDNKKNGDPYAEIAAGPDRPKIPELKTGNVEENDSPVMKLNNGEVKANNGKPLTGQHDVGGLLDRLTDKLNKEGGVAMDNAQMDDTASNDVKYIQSPLGLDDTTGGGAGAAGNILQDGGQDKQLQAYGLDKLKDQADHNDIEKMAEQEGLLGGSDAAAAAASPTTGLDSLAQAGLGAGSNLPTSASETAGLGGIGADNTVVGAGNAEEDGMAKSLSKASALTTNAIMDVLKSAKLPGSSEYSNADISAGPDPYSSDQSAGQSTAAASEPVGSLFGSENTLDSGELGTNPAFTGGSETDEETTDSIGGTDDESFQRNTIPLDSESDRRQEEPSYRDEDNYRDRYNAVLFKKHIIMRPKRDTYVSPFHDKEAFDTAI